MDAHKMVRLAANGIRCVDRVYPVSLYNEQHVLFERTHIAITYMQNNNEHLEAIEALDEFHI